MLQPATSSRGCENRPPLSVLLTTSGGMADPSSFRPTFIRAWREHRKLSQDELAFEANVDKGNLSKLERGIYPYRQPILESIAKALKVSPGRLIESPPDESTPLWDAVDRAPPEVRRQIAAAAEAILNASRKE